MKIYEQYDELRDASLDLTKAVDELTKRLRISYSVIDDFFELMDLQGNEREMYSELLSDIERNNECIDISGKSKEYNDMYRDHINLPRVVELYKTIKEKCEVLHQV